MFLFNIDEDGIIFNNGGAGFPSIVPPITVSIPTPISEKLDTVRSAASAVRSMFS